MPCILLVVTRNLYLFESYSNMVAIVIHRNSNYCLRLLTNFSSRMGYFHEGVPKFQRSGCFFDWKDDTFDGDEAVYLTLDCSFVSTLVYIQFYSLLPRGTSSIRSSKEEFDFFWPSNIYHKISKEENENNSAPFSLARSFIQPIIFYKFITFNLFSLIISLN